VRRSNRSGASSASAASHTGALAAASAKEEGEVSPRPRLTAAVSLCNPFNLTLGDWNWRRPDAGFRRAYDKYLAARMSDVFSQNWETLAAGAARPSSPSGSRHVPDSSTGVRPKESSSAGATPTSGSSEGVPPAGRSRAQGGIDAQRSTHDNIRPDIPISAEDQEALASVSGVQVNSSSGSSSISSVPGSTGDRLPAVSEDAPSSFNGSNSRSSSSSDSSAPAGSLHGPVSGNPAPDSSTTSFHAKDPRNWPIRIPKPLIPVRPTLIRPEAAQRAPTVRDFDDAATRHWFGFDSVDEYYAAASSAYHLHAVDTPLMCISAEDDPICPKEAIPMEAFNENPCLLLVTTPTGGHLGWIDLSPAGGGWRGRPWTEDVMFDYLQAVLAQERNACNNG